MSGPWIYYFSIESKLFETPIAKVGYTKNLKKREKEHKKDYHCTKIELIHKRQIKNITDEKGIHKQLAHLRYDYKNYKELYIISDEIITIIDNWVIGSNDSAKPEYKVPDYDDDNYTTKSLFDVNSMQMKSNKYWNASQFCRVHHKEYSNWRKLKDTHNIINITAEHLGLSVDNIIIETKKPKKSTTKPINEYVCGVYVPTILMIHIALWCNVNYWRYIAQIISIGYIDESNFQDDPIIDAFIDYSNIDFTTKEKLIITKNENIIKNIRYEMAQMYAKRFNLMEQMSLARSKIRKIVINKQTKEITDKITTKLVNAITTKFETIKTNR